MDDDLIKHYQKIDERNLHSDFRLKQVRVRQAKKMSDIVSQLLIKKGYAQVQTAEACDAAWKQVSGRFANQTRCGKVRRGVLEVLVANSAILQDLTFQKTKLVKYLGELVADQKIKDVKFRVANFD